MSILTKHQVKTYGPKEYTEHGRIYRITAEVRHDDSCGNGHNSFGITATIERKAGNRWEWDAGGCCHEEAVKHFPELAPYIKWHLCSTDGPLHYVANTIYLAGDRDHWGLRKGEFRQHTSRGKQNGGVAGVPNWELVIPEHRDMYADEKPAPVVCQWRPSGITGEGKDRELDAARRAAIWPDATDADLTEPGLKERLEARLPALLAEFQAAVESLGLIF